jgi:hypothetical protein
MTTGKDLVQINDNSKNNYPFLPNKANGSGSYLFSSLQLQLQVN